MIVNQSSFKVLIISTAIFLIGILEAFAYGMLNYFKYMAIILPVLYTINMPIKIKNRNCPLIYGIIIYLVFELILNLFHEEYMTITTYILLNILFIVYIAKSSMILNNIESITRFMYYTNLLIASIIFLSFITEPVFIFNKGLISNVIINAGRERYRFNFQHANYLGSICFIFFVNLSFIITTKISKNKKLILAALAVFVFYILLLSGSRTATYAYLLFFVLYTMQKIYHLPYGKYILGAFSIIILIFAYKYISTIDMIDLLNNTNRLGPLLYNYKLYIRLGKIYTGIGFYNHMSIYSLEYLFKNIDNYFIYVFITQGYIGLAVTLAIIIIVFYSIGKIPDRNIKCFMFAFFISFIVYSMFETYFYIPGAFLSYYFWTIGYSMININFQRTETINNNSDSLADKTLFIED